MTSVDPGSVSILTPAAPEAAILTEALHLAVRRDLARLTLVLATPVTAVRRAALVDHSCFVLDQLTAHHRVMDAVSWPAVLARRPEFEDVATRVALAHAEVAGPITAVRNASLAWRDDPDKRLTLLSAVRDLLAALTPVLDQDATLAPVVDDVLSAESAPPVQWRTAAWFGAPTRVARRTFWLLDELDPRRASLLTARTPLAVMWVLRNGFSGAYNRSAYLMWVGGGTGPAV